MDPLTRSLRNGAVAAAAAATLLALTAPAALAGGAAAEVEVAYDCTSIEASSSRAISNVVLQFADGDTQRFEDLPERRTGTFAGTADDAGEVITTAWVKSGDNKSGDGPGYGERFDFDASACDDGYPTGGGATSSEGPGNDDNGQTTNGDTDDPADGGTEVGSSSTDTPGSDTTDDTTTGAPDDSDDDATEAGDPDTDGEDGDSDTGVGSTSANADTDDTDADIAGDPEDDDAADAADAAEDQADEAGTTPDARVLGVVHERAAEDGLRAADASEVRSAGLLPNTGADAGVALAAALAALALGGGLLRRSSSHSA